VSWPSVKLGEVCKFVRGPFGGALKKECFVEDGFAVYEQQHAIYNQFSEIRYFVDEIKFNELKRFMLDPGDLIMSCSGTMGKIAIVPDNIKAGIINQALLKLTPSEAVDINYLKYWLESESFQFILNGMTHGAAIKNVASVAVLKEIEIPLPPLDEQKRIAAILDQADSIRRKRQQAIKLADDFLRSAFLDMFGDPISNPKGWEIGNFSDICTLNPKADKYDDELPVSFVPMPSVSESSHILNPSDIREYSTVKKGFTAFKENDVLFAKITPCMENGKAAIATNLKNSIGYGSTEFHVFRPQDIDYAPFIYSLLHLPLFRKIASSNFSGAVGHKRVPKDFLSKFKLILPPEHLVIKFKVLFETVNESKSKFDTNVENSEQLFNSLSQKAFAGEL